MKQQSSTENGFSLIELLIAMTITLIVSGAIYGLMTAGQNAFRREPELAERQQNIRLAMDMIVRDLANAGTGLPPLTQVFTQGLGDWAASPPGPSGAAHSDDLEVLTVSGRDSEPVCMGASNGSVNEVSLVRRSTLPILPGTLVFLVHTSDLAVPPDGTPAVHDDMWTVRRLSAAPFNRQGPLGPLTWSECLSTGTADHLVLTFAPDPAYPENAASLCTNAPVAPFGNLTATPCSQKQITRVVFGRQVRYQVRTDPTDGVPVLQRISSEDPTPQVLARGIEELQVAYTQFTAPATWLDAAPDVAEPAAESWTAASGAGKFGTIVNQVRITLTSRSEAQRIQGATNRADGTDPRIRGSLTSTVSPRAALLNVARGRPSPDPGGYWE